MASAISLQRGEDGRCEVLQVFQLGKKDDNKFQGQKSQDSSAKSRFQGSNLFFAKMRSRHCHELICNLQSYDRYDRWQTAKFWTTLRFDFSFAQKGTLFFDGRQHSKRFRFPMTISLLFENPTVSRDTEIAEISAGSDRSKVTYQKTTILSALIWVLRSKSCNVFGR